MIITNEKTGRSISFTYSKKQDLVEAANIVSVTEESITDRKLKLEGKLHQLMYDIQEEIIKQIQSVGFLGGEAPLNTNSYVQSLDLKTVRITKVFISEVGNVTMV